MSLLEVKNIRKSYGKLDVLKGIDFSLEKGEVLSILGSSGSGKTTLLRALNGLLWEEPEAEMKGEICLQGRDTRTMDREELRRRVGLVFQTPQPFPFSIYNNMTYAPRYYGIRKKEQLEEIVREKLMMAGLYEEVKGELSKSALKLSGGQKQRLCIARALTAEPEVLLLDEPCSALDVKASAVIEETLLGLKERYTIVIVTHNISQARRIADDAAFFSEGRLVEYGKAETLFTAPEKEETRSFLTGVCG